MYCLLALNKVKPHFKCSKVICKALAELLLECGWSVCLKCAHCSLIAADNVDGGGGLLVLATRRRQQRRGALT